MQALIDFLIRNLLALWPIARVHEWKQGLLVRNGRIRRELPPGLHWRWWFIEEVLTWPANTIAQDLETAAVTTTDGTSVAISANYAYRMLSIAKMYRGVWNTEPTLNRLILGCIATHCAQEAWDYLQHNRADLEARLVVAVNAKVTHWGVVVDTINLTDLVRVRPYRHYMDGKL